MNIVKTILKEIDKFNNEASREMGRIDITLEELKWVLRKVLIEDHQVYIDKKGDWILKTIVTKSAKTLGRKGGLATKKKYGKKHYQKLAENMNKKRWGDKKRINKLPFFRQEDNRGRMRSVIYKKDLMEAYEIKKR